MNIKDSGEKAMPENPRYLNGKQAIRFLADMWGMGTYSDGAFRAYRFRLKNDPELARKLKIAPEDLEPALRDHSSTFWTEDQLRRFPKPDRSNPRGKRLKHVNEDEDEGSKGADTSVLFKRSVAWSYACEEAPDFDLVGARG